MLTVKNLRKKIPKFEMFLFHCNSTDKYHICLNPIKFDAFRCVPSHTHDG